MNNLPYIIRYYLYVSKYIVSKIHVGIENQQNISINSYTILRALMDYYMYSPKYKISLLRVQHFTSY